MAQTKISSRGRIVLPKAIRDKRRWKAGMHLVVEERPEGVLLKPVEKKKKKTLTIADWVGILKYEGPARTVEEMNVAIDEDFRLRYARRRF